MATFKQKTLMINDRGNSLVQNSQEIKPRDYSLLQQFLHDPNTMRLRQSEKTSFHVAMIVQRGKILQISSNRLGTRSKGCGFAKYTIHAEKNVVRQLGDTNLIRGCDLFIMRIQYNKSTNIKTFSNSKPCHECDVFIEKCKKTYGLRNAYYTGEPVCCA